MPRPVKCRTVCCSPRSDYFKPGGIPVRQLEEVSLTMDELEAVRLADLEGMYQEDAASRMNISRQTFGNIISSAHNKIADALLNAKSLRIKGGTGTLAETRRFECGGCNNVWQVVHGTERPRECPQCRCMRIHGAEGDKDSAKKRVSGLRRKRCGRS